MGTAAKIWKDLKADLKARHFDETKTDKELLAACDNRVNQNDWKWLIKHWRSPLAKVSQTLKKNTCYIGISLLFTASIVIGS